MDESEIRRRVESYLRPALQAEEHVAAMRAQSVGPCSTCAHYSLAGDYQGLCGHPLVRGPRGYSVVHGTVSEGRRPEAYKLRSEESVWVHRDGRREVLHEEGLCGPVGRMWERRPTPLSWLRRFASLLEELLCGTQENAHD